MQVSECEKYVVFVLLADELVCFQDKLKLHEQTHLDGMNFTCPVEGCSKAFRRSDRLREHMRYHRDGPCICPHCGKALSRKDNLNQHMVIHNGNYPYWSVHVHL